MVKKINRKRDIQMIFRCTPRERDLIRENAKVNGLGVGEYLRYLLIISRENTFRKNLTAI